ncbi:hypothetical protein P175DRAFT_0250002 [Aspergillus ochraceoroseus IBT 24754]|uniref:Uncharacterized protein n=1 Tax=Aspergillus ochraceoroseus IBT 24754 TaxID=1392256 RepID=A0A2T5LY33_9EURO|nr:uncharacterized protein P175DRAFT_0250002 [Aspergillus ochraceoroseus IBT 24754]PTU21198.1 hypothetical protein P175DRAFT_0250002 [Aspergillus ochraceoroseus IBT 24754]
MERNSYLPSVFRPSFRGWISRFPFTADQEVLPTTPEVVGGGSGIRDLLLLILSHDYSQDLSVLQKDSPVPSSRLTGSITIFTLVEFSIDYLGPCCTANSACVEILSSINPPHNLGVPGVCFKPEPEFNHQGQKSHLELLTFHVHKGTCHL